MSDTLGSMWSTRGRSLTLSHSGLTLTSVLFLILLFLVFKCLRFFETFHASDPKFARHTHAACCRVAECGAKLDDALGGVPLGSMSQKLVDEARDGRAEMEEIVNRIAPMNTCPDISARINGARPRQRRRAGVWHNGAVAGPRRLKAEAVRVATKAA